MHLQGSPPRLQLDPAADHRQIWNYYVFRERIRPDEGGLDRGY